MDLATGRNFVFNLSSGSGLFLFLYLFMFLPHVTIRGDIFSPVGRRKFEFDSSRLPPDCRHFPLFLRIYQERSENTRESRKFAMRRLDPAAISSEPMLLIFFVSFITIRPNIVPNIFRRDLNRHRSQWILIFLLDRIISSKFFFFLILIKCLKKWRNSSYAEANKNKSNENHSVE